MSSSVIRARFDDEYPEGILERDPLWLSTGNTDMNSALGHPKKGLCTGIIYELYSMEGKGKTSLAHKLLSLYQKAGGVAVLVDEENAYDEPWAKKQGVDTDDLIVIRSEVREVVKRGKKKDVVCEGMEELFAKLDHLVTIIREEVPDKPSAIVWDSVAGTPSRAELDGNWEDSQMAAQARALSKGLRRLVGVLSRSPVTLICLNQMRQNIGGFITISESTGGKALKYYASVRALIAGASPKGGVMMCEVRNRKNRKSPPLQTGYFKIDFNKGVSWVKKRKRKS